MSGAERILFEFGLEGGGSCVYKLPDNSVVEKGSSGGILDEEEEPIKQWKNIYDNWDAWWLNFTSKNQDQWIYFYPIFIHPDIKKSIQVAVESISSNSDDMYHKEKWNRRLSEI